MKIAIAHDYLIQMGGAERVVEVLHDMYPDAPIFTTVSHGNRLPESLKNADIRTTWLQNFPGVKTNFKKMLPLYPLAIRDFDFRGYDIVLSSSSAFVKSIEVPKNTFHLCYCHTPMRFAWDYDTYMERESQPSMLKKLLKVYIRQLKSWDQRTSSNVNQFVANSSVVQRRIQNYYQRDAEVIFPPINTSRFRSSSEVEDYYLIVSRLVSYKRIDLAVEAFNQSGLPLYIVGDGPDRKRLAEMAKPNVKFLGRLEDGQVNELMSKCRAFIFPGEEDFGITPLEANAAGRPVIAYQAGGALDTIVPYVNGVFFRNQKVDDLLAAVGEVERHAWNVSQIMGHAKKFDEDTFKQQFKQYVEQAYVNFLKGGSGS
ncbi:glycosyltransferase [Paenibacillus pinistramenti]|uniref:glycosyltransferase n=1 Tax=Paenibacillus pinistramenti TaxID=1768003 RepID=UPI0011080003|nr:glycosyltransferase [Paenibacillus pinistramenti]